MRFTKFESTVTTIYYKSRKMSEIDSQAEKPKEPEPEPDGKRIFLSHANTYEG